MLVNSKVLLIHGWQGSPSPHWQYWLNEALTKQNISCTFPRLDDDMRPIKDVWLNQIVKSLETSQADTVITHSLGAMVWFHLCALQKVKPVERLLIVAPPRDLRDIDVLKNFFPCETPLNCFAKEVTLVSSDNDIYMNTKEATKMANTLQAKHMILKDAGHINADSNYGKWPWVLDWVLKDK